VLEPLHLLELVQVLLKLGDRLEIVNQSRVGFGQQHVLVRRLLNLLTKLVVLIEHLRDKLQRTFCTIEQFL